MRVVLAVGSTRTALIEGISAAGADPAAMAHTPAADAEIVAYGRPVLAPAVPVSPTGCPTPALVTRAVRELVGFDLLSLDAGLDAPTAAPTHRVADRPGGDVRDPEPVPDAGDVFESARDLARGLPDRELVVAESVPGGTTTALGILTALGEPHGVSSSLPENPIERKREVVDAGLDASGIEAGELSGRPLAALRLMGDPVLAAALGMVAGGADRGATVTLAGGTQMVAVAALARGMAVTAPLALATTPFVADDESADLRDAAAALDLDLTVTDPGFAGAGHVVAERYLRGEAKEGAGMGGALALAERDGVSMTAVRERVFERYDEVVRDGP